jgi:GTPase SAR1 family protein
MDDKATATPTVGKTVNSWYSLGTTQKAILLIGPSHTGKTTFA